MKAACTVAALCVMLGACGTRPVPGTTPSSQLAERPPDPALGQMTQDLTPSQRYEHKLLARAHEQFTQGQLADAAMSWEILATLRPAEAEYAQRLQETRKLVDAALAQALQRGAQLQKKGELDSAANQYLAALALQPDRAQAAAGLRSIERERMRRGITARTARVAGSGMVAAPAPAPANSTAPAERNDLEHASILAALGEIDAAIVLLERRIARNKGTADLPACRKLAELYVQRSGGSSRESKPLASPCPRPR